jgi:hypothetical protein
MKLFLIIEYTIARTYYRAIVDNQQLAEQIKYDLVAKAGSDEHNDLLIGVDMFGPFELNSKDNIINKYDLVERDTLQIDKNDFAIHGDFKISGNTVTLLQDKVRMTNVIDRIDAEVVASEKRASDEIQMRKDLKKLGLDIFTIEAMIKAKKEGA